MNTLCHLGVDTTVLYHAGIMYWDIVGVKMGKTKGCVFFFSFLVHISR